LVIIKEKLANFIGVRISYILRHRNAKLYLAIDSNSNFLFFCSYILRNNQNKMKTRSIVYNFKGYFDRPAKCHLLINGNYVIATEVDDNPGTSITNAVESLAMQVCRDFAISPEKLVWIEHYPQSGELPYSILPESFDIVSFSIENGVLSNAKWRKIDGPHSTIVDEITKSAKPKPSLMRNGPASVGY
jgi:hypothetical protein